MGGVKYGVRGLLEVSIHRDKTILSGRAGGVAVRMKELDTNAVTVVKAGRKLELPAPLELGQLMRVLERNDASVFWMQPADGTVDDQFACVCVNDKYYALSAKLEKAVFRNVRLTRDFRNYEYLADGTKKLRIPHRLFAEKLRTSSRVRAACLFMLCLCRAKTELAQKNITERRGHSPGRRDRGQAPQPPRRGAGPAREEEQEAAGQSGQRDAQL